MSQNMAAVANIIEVQSTIEPDVHYAIMGELC